jgi:hypothetical protein
MTASFYERCKQQSILIKKINSSNIEKNEKINKREDL